MLLILFLFLWAQCAAVQFQNQSNSHVHAFYYLWYGNIETDGKYFHWNHEVLPHWTPEVNEQYPQVGQRFEPPASLHSPYYPERGPYSSRDSDTILQHFEDLRHGKIGVIVLSWWGQASNAASTDTQGVSTDAMIPVILSLAERFGDIKIALHLEPYPGRSAPSVRNDIEYIHQNYGHYTSLLRTSDNRIVLYIYDSYHISPHDWSGVLSATGMPRILFYSQRYHQDCCYKAK